MRGGELLFGNMIPFHSSLRGSGELLDGGRGIFGMNSVQRRIRLKV